MIVECSSCQTNFPVDPKKVPSAGIHARCSVCGEVFFVKPPEPETARVEPEPTPGVEARVEPEGDVSEPESQVEPGDEVYPAESAESPPTPEQGEPEGLPDQPTEEFESLESAELEDATGHPPEELGSEASAAEEEDQPAETWVTAQEPEEFVEQPPEGFAQEAQEHIQDEAPEEFYEGESEEFESGESAEPEYAAGPPPGELGSEAFTAEDEDQPAETWVTAQESEEFAEDAQEEFAEHPQQAFAEHPPEDVQGEEPEGFAEEPREEIQGEAPEEEPSPEVVVEAREEDSAAATPIAPPVFGKRNPMEKAQRLARVLVSDIILYNPDRHQNATQSGRVREEFEEEIQKSWAEYVEQVGEEVANTTSFFTDALNEILARGEQVF